MRKGEVRMIVNGAPVTAIIQPKMTLLRFLRDHLRLTGTKCGCGAGECGTCIVIVNGEAKKSCLQKVSRLEGATIQTIEGLSVHELASLSSRLLSTRVLFNAVFALPA